MLVVKRIHVTYELEVEDEEHREAARRMHEVHADYCPVAQTLQGCVEITTELTFR